MTQTAPETTDSTASSASAPGRPPGRISVVIPTYQRAALLPRAIESVLAQSLPADEIIVVDDGSTDGTSAAVRRFREYVHYLRQDNAGCSAARNRGVREASGDWIAFLDSDDAWQPTHLEAMASAIEATSGQAALYFADSIFPNAGPDGEDRTLWDLSGFTVDAPYRFTDDASDWVMRPRQPLKLQCCVFRRDLFLRQALMEELLTREDTHFFLRTGLGQPMCAVADAGVCVHFDDVPENRLTAAHPPSGRVYLEATVRLYADILAHHAPERLDHRNELRRRLGAARIRLAKADWRERRVLAAIAHLVRGVCTWPANVGPMIGRRIRRMLP